MDEIKPKLSTKGRQMAKDLNGVCFQKREIRSKNYYSWKNFPSQRKDLGRVMNQEDGIPRTSSILDGYFVSNHMEQSSNIGSKREFDQR